HCAAFASSTSGERVGVSGLLSRSRRFLLLLVRRLVRLLRWLPLPACGERVGVRGHLRCFGLRRSPLTRRAPRRSRCVRIGVLSAKNAGRRPALLSPRAGRGNAWGCSLPRRRCLDYGGRGSRHRRIGAVLDHGAMILAGERILPLEGVEPP